MVNRIESAATSSVTDKPVHSATLRQNKQPIAAANGPIPPLENGDYLGRAEFGRRYQAYPQIKKTELMERTVYISPPPFVYANMAYPLVTSLAG